MKSKQISSLAVVIITHEQEFVKKSSEKIIISCGSSSKTVRALNDTAADRNTLGIHAWEIKIKIENRKKRQRRKNTNP